MEVILETGGSLLGFFFKTRTKWFKGGSWVSVDRKLTISGYRYRISYPLTNGRIQSVKASKSCWDRI